MNRVYFFRDGTSPNDLHYEDIDQVSGLITASGETPYHGDYPITPPIRVSVDGTRVLIGSGNIFDANAMTWQFALAQPITDAEWLTDGRLVTIRPDGADTAFEVLNTAYATESSSVVQSPPIATLRYGDDVVVIASGLRPEFSVVTP